MHVLFQPTSCSHCRDAWACALQVVYETSAKIECAGYHSCKEAISIKSSDGYSISCTGSYSCYEADLIEYSNSTTSPSSILCAGLFSCAFVELIKNTNGDIHCTGELSCSESTIILSNETNGILYCRGDRSCAKSHITNANTIYISGHMAGSQTTFTSFISNHTQNNNTSHTYWNSA